MSDFGLLMSDEYNYRNEKGTNHSNKTNEKETSEDSKIKVIKVIFVLLCLVLLGELIYYKVVTPMMNEPKVTISGQNLFTAEEIAMKLLPMDTSSWAKFDVDEAVSLLCSEPGIENAIVEKKFPDNVYINVIEREAVALTFVIENGHSNPVQIDKNGVLFPVRNNSDINSNKLPIISGLPVEHLSGGMRIPVRYRPLMEDISEITSLDNNYFASISEICVIPKDETDSYELALIPSQSKVRVLIDRTLNEDALKYMMIVLDVINVLDKDVTEVDLRYGSVSCIMK